MGHVETFKSLVVSFRVIQPLPGKKLEKCQVFVNNQAVPISVEKVKKRNHFQTYRVRYDDPKTGQQSWTLTKDSAKSVATALAKDFYIQQHEDVRDERDRWELASRSKPTLVKGKGID